MTAAPGAMAQNADTDAAQAMVRAGDVPGAITRLEGAAAKGNSFAMRLLGDLYYDGEPGLPADQARSLAWYRKGAEMGNPGAMYSLGWQYGAGEGTAKDPVEALKWYRRAADKGNPEGMYQIGAAYYNGNGVAKEVNEGVRWYRKAAEAGNGWAMVSWGYAQFSGEGTAKDEAGALHWFRKGGEAGSATASLNAGIFYRDGVGAPRNLAAAYYWFLRAAMAEKPDPDAEKEIAVLRENGTLFSAEGKALADQADSLGRGAKTNAEFQASKPKAFALHQQAAQLGHLPSINMMMLAYRERGWGVEPDLVKAREWAQISAEMDDKEGQRVLGAFMLNGNGGPRNAQGARFWFEKSALQGNPQSMMTLAQIYDGDKGLPPNEALAIYWYKQAYAKNWFGAEQVLLARGVLKPDPVSTAFIERIDRQGPNRASLDTFTLDVAQYCKYGGSRCTALSIEARKMEKAQNNGAEAANMARLWNVYSNPSQSDAKWRERSECMRKKTESIQRHTYGQQDWYYSGSCY